MGEIEAMSHPWATHCMRFPASEERNAVVEEFCRKHAQINCPPGLTYHVQWHGDAWEWFAPAYPPGFAPVWKTFTNGPDKIVGWMPINPERPNARYFA